MQNHLEGAVRACRCRCPSWVPLLFVMGCLNLLVTMAHAQFTLGTGRVVSVTPLDGGCISQDLPPSGTENWNIEQVFRYRVRLENVTECSGDTIHVHLFNPFRSEDDPDDCYHPQCLEATRVGDGAYEFTVRFPAPPRQGKRYFIRYCTSADCSAGGLLARRSDGGNAPSELRLSRFNQDCVWLAENKCEEPPVRCRDLDLGCLPSNDEVPDCSALAALNIETDCPAGFVLLRCENGTIEPDPNREPCGYRRQNTYIIKDLCTFQVWELQCWVFWQVDNEPPVIEPPDGGDLGCNPVPPECPIIIQQTTVKDNCLHEPPTVDCRYEDRRDGCIVTRTFTITATDKCGNTSTATVTYTWNEDTEPPVVNNVPETDKLPCNTRPTCDLLIARHNIHAKDNCTHEPPTLRCEPGEVVDLGNCRFRQTFTFWAVDKCGNRSDDYPLEVNWRVDNEPPVIEPPDGGDLGCNPRELPTCPSVLERTTITDNCDPRSNLQVDCRFEDVRDGCIVTRTFTITATDKCGNTSTATVVYTWNEDTEPPVVNNVPETDKLPCNTRPTCDLLIARHNIHAKDNCTHEPPTLHCEPGEVVDLGNCRFRQTFTFWAVDKCGNRSRDYQLVVFWKEDTEPPVLHNVPEDRDLGCNPTHIPDCDEIRSGVYATDNCDPDVPVTCTYRDIVIGCLRIRSFILAAADECGNVTTRKVVVSWTEDTTPPIVRCPDNITVQAQFPDCLVPVTWRAKAEDDCDPRPSVACNPPSGSFFGLGTTTVTCTATDRCGNSASCQFTVTVLGYICGYKFRDDNGNGVWEPHLGEPPLAGWTIELRDQLGNVLQTTTTGPDGKFCFLGLTSPGTYVVCEVLQNGWVNTTPICRTVVLPRDCGKLSFFGNRPLTQQ